LPNVSQGDGQSACTLIQQDASATIRLSLNQALLGQLAQPVMTSSGSLPHDALPQLWFYNLTACMDQSFQNRLTDGHSTMAMDFNGRRIHCAHNHLLSHLA
jgi:hypothetical protein